MRQIQISVRTLVEFIYRSGDLDSSLKSGVTMQEGIRIHQLVQSEYEGFQKEVSLKLVMPIDQDSELVLTGRADGVLQTSEETVIDEIKSTFVDLDEIDETYSFMHWAQAKLYGAMLASDQELENIGIQVTYYSLKTEKKKSLKINYPVSELMAFLDQTVNLFRKWLAVQVKLETAAEVSAEKVPFPFGQFRKGQDVLAKSVYASVRDGNHLIVEAPTGIGKTLSTLFPAIKALGKGFTKRIFYLTSKTSHRKVALDALEALQDKGLDVLVVGLQAKEKLCTNDVFTCTPGACPYAKGHFDRINEALFDVVSVSGHYNPTAIREIAMKWVVCPFELALDITDFSQVVVCDYNYFLDPFVLLKRHFSSKSNAVILMDEAHNLYERARDMYTATLSLKNLKNVIKLSKELDKGYHQLLKKIQAPLKKNIEQADERGLINSLDLRLLNAISKAALYFLDQGRFSEVTKQIVFVDHFFELHRFLKILEYQDDHFAFMVDEKEPDVMVLRCLDPSKILETSYELVRSVVSFSATLSPFSFYQGVLGHSNSKRLQVGSPFDVSNRLLWLNTRHSTYQKDRTESLEPIAQDIAYLLNERTGNYFIFCPSYAYLELLKPILEPMLPPQAVLAQSSGMSEDERELFLEAFVSVPTTTKVGMVVLGGAFSEGVDLRGERLSGVIIIGVGMPVLSHERFLMRDYYEGKGYNGFDYAFTYPGLNKVFQAGGRLIRTEADKGLLMLICKRYGEKRFLNEFPKHWHPHQIIRTEAAYHQEIKKMQDFFK